MVRWVLSTGRDGTGDSHPRHRSGPPPHRLGHDRLRRQPADLCGLRLGRDERQAALAERLVTIHDGLARIVDEFRPDEAAVEATFVNRDATATLKLGQARGIALLVPAKAGVSVAEYAPNLVKKTIVGAGHAEKAQIRLMVGVLLPKADPQSEDAADALAIAVTHAHHRASALLKVAMR